MTKVQDIKTNKEILFIRVHSWLKFFTEILH